MTTSRISMSNDSMVQFLQSIASQAVNAQRLISESNHLDNEDVRREVSDLLAKADDLVGTAQDVIIDGLED